jgi:predicted acyl esterase
MKNFFVIIFSLSAWILCAQPNGKLDEFADFSTSFPYEFTISDGVHLSTDFYLPITSDSLVVEMYYGSTPYPIQIVPRGIQIIIYDSLNGEINPNPYQLPMVFTRTPYNKGHQDALAIIMNLLGYAYTLQDMRGRYHSEGVYFAMYSDSWKKDAYHPNQSHILDFTDIDDPHNSIYHQDGKESIDFLQDSLMWGYDLDNDGITDTIAKAYNGYLAMFGASAMGNSQYQAVSTYKKEEVGNDLKTIIPIVATLEYFDGVVQQNGVFRQALIVNWLTNQMDDVNGENSEDNDMQNNVHSNFDFGGLSGDEIIDLAIDQFCSYPDENGFTAMYPNYQLRPDLDGSYAFINENGESSATGNSSRYSNMEVPAYHLTGWWDIFIDGQIDTYHKIMENTSTENRQMQKLVIGPWSHGTIGMDSVGDIRYPESVFDVNILYGDISDNTDNIRVDKIVESEVLSWMRQHLNYQEENYLAEPKVLIPESNEWQEFGPYQIRIPAHDYYIRYPNFVNYITGHEDLINMPVLMQTPDTLLEFTINIEADTSVQVPNSDPVGDPATTIIDFAQVKNVRYYVPGPVNDGITENENVGNYWYECDDFPLSVGIEWQSFFLHSNGSINQISAEADEQELEYIHDPDQPVQTIGGGNLTLRTPVIDKRNAGPIDLSNPYYAPLTMDREDVLQFETDYIEDSLCMMGYPKVKIFVSSSVEGGGATDADFFIRILDVYPDGRELFVVEGAVNARARDYAASIFNEQADDEVQYSNIESGQLYELDFQMLPIAYTFGHQHKLKVLISSSNYPRYQSNPSLPIEQGEFFRRDAGDGQVYEYNGQNMTPRLAMQRVFFGPETKTQIILPVYNGNGIGVNEQPKSVKTAIIMSPNPTSAQLYYQIEKQGHFLMTLRSISGRTVLQKNVIGNTHLQIDTKGLAKGVYLLEVKDEFGFKDVVKFVCQ